MVLSQEIQDELKKLALPAIRQFTDIPNSAILSILVRTVFTTQSMRPPTTPENAAKAQEKENSATSPNLSTERSVKKSPTRT
jgi:hypothetical protein